MSEFKYKLKGYLESKDQEQPDNNSQRTIIQYEEPKDTEIDFTRRNTSGRY